MTPAEARLAEKCVDGFLCGYTAEQLASYYMLPEDDLLAIILEWLNTRIGNA